MGCGSVRSPEKLSVCLLLILVTASLLCGIAGAEIYDDFGGPAIDTTKWTLSGTMGLFSQSNGRLHFFCKTDTAESLVSTRSFEPGFFRMEFYDFYSTNDAPPGRGLGSYAALGLGPRENYVRMLRGRVVAGGYYEANYFSKNALQLWYVPTADSSGQLGLYYDGSTVTFFYNNGLNPEKGWQRVGPKVTPGWNFQPKLFIRGYPGGDGRTRFGVDNVQYLPLPLPPDLLKRLER